MTKHAEHSLPSVGPLVSVIIPAYNAASYLKRALDSALAQTMSNLEVIVVDDASVDATVEVAGRSAAQDSRIRLLENEQNYGNSASRNRGIGAARGEWIALLDADDAWHPERLEQMMTEADDADVVSDDVCIVHETLVDSSKFATRSLIQQQNLNIEKPKWINALDFVEYDLGLLKPIFRRAFLIHHHLSYRSDVSLAEDYLLYFDILVLNARWKQLPQAYYLYYKHVGTLTYSNSRDQSKKLVLWQSTLENTQTLLRCTISKKDVALASALNRHRKRALEHIAFATFWEALRQRRFSDLMRQFYRHPADSILVAKYISERLSMRLMRTIRYFSDRDFVGGMVRRPGEGS